MINKRTMWFLIILGVLLLILGCDNIKCTPDTHPDKKGWYFGGKCGGTW